MPPPPDPHPPDEAPERRRGCLVTGASTGIGRATARALADAGFACIGTVRSAEDAEAVREEGILPLRLDVTDREAVEGLADAVEELLEGRPLYGLVNNAGIAPEGPLELQPAEEFRRVFEVNLLGAAAVTRSLLPLLREARGRVVNVSSVSALVPPPFLGAYAASKAGLEALSDSLRREVGPLGVDVSVVQPGTVRTPIWDKAARRDPERYRGSPYEGPLLRLREQALAGGERGLPPDEVARAVVELLTARRPATRVLIASQSWLYRILGLLPDRLVDWFVERSL